MLVAGLVVAAGLGLTALPAEAARAEKGAAKASGQPVTAVAAQEVETTSSVSVKPNASDDARCDVARKRLFVEGEGWIVRRVTTCY
jgi:hypothetical protein